MEKILFATDFSERSRNAFSYALQSARLFGAELVLVHVYRIPDTYMFPYTLETLAFEKNEIDESKNKLQEIFDTYYGRDFADVNIRYRVVKDSSVYRGIIRAVDEEFPAILMLGAKGDNVSQEDYFGGVVQNLIQNTVIPVFTIPEDFSRIGINKILFTSNLYDSDIVAIKQLVQQLRSVNPKITIVHVRTHEENEQVGDIDNFWEKVRKAIDYPNLVFQELQSDDIYHSLNEYIHHNEFDVLSMTNKQHSGLFYRLVHDDLLLKLETQSAIPILSFNDEGLDIVKEVYTSIREFKDTIDTEMVEIKQEEENSILTAISKITVDIQTNYPGLYSSLEEEPITLPTDNHPNVNIDDMAAYLDSLQEKVQHYKKPLGTGHKELVTKVHQ